MWPGWPGVRLPLCLELIDVPTILGSSTHGVSSSSLRGMPFTLLVSRPYICWAIWNLHNRATFEFKQLKYPFEVIFSSCVYLLYWAGLQLDDDED